MDEREAKLAEVLERAEHVHGVVSESRGGADPDWPLFYAWWLLNWSDLSEVLDARPSLSSLAFELMRLDAEFRAGGSSEPWAMYYATRLLANDWTA